MLAFWPFLRRSASYDGGLPHNHRKAPGPDTARLDVCFGPFWTMGVDVSAVEMFERVGFVHHACGDQSAPSSTVSLQWRR